MSFFTVAEIHGIDKPGFLPVTVNTGNLEVTILKCGHAYHDTKAQARRCLNMAFDYTLVHDRMIKGEPYLLGRDWIPRKWIKPSKVRCPNKWCGRHMDRHEYPAFMNTPVFYWCTGCGHDSRTDKK